MGTGRGIQNQGSRGKWCWIWIVALGFNGSNQILGRTSALLFLGGDGLLNPAGSVPLPCDTAWIEFLNHSWAIHSLQGSPGVWSWG